MKPQDKLIIDRFRNSGFTVSDLIHYCFRYFLGRRTAVTGTLANALVEVWPLLEQPVQDQIKKELENALFRDNKARESKSKKRFLGDDCDRREWEKVLDNANR